MLYGAKHGTPGSIPADCRGPVGPVAEERRQRTGGIAGRVVPPTLTPSTAEDEALTAEEQEGHQLDDLA